MRHLLLLILLLGVACSASTATPTPWPLEEYAARVCLTDEEIEERLAKSEQKGWEGLRDIWGRNREWWRETTPPPELRGYHEGQRVHEEAMFLWVDQNLPDGSFDQNDFGLQFLEASQDPDSIIGRTLAEYNTEDWPPVSQAGIDALAKYCSG